MYRNPAWMYCVPVLIWLYKFLLCFPINVSASYYKVDCTSFMGNSRGGLNSSSYYENKVCNNRRKINCVDADEPCIPWAWDSNMKQCWGPGCNITKHDSLEERTSSAFILVFPPFFSCNTHQQPDHTGSLHRSTWWKWDGEAERDLQQRVVHVLFLQQLEA